MEEIARQHRRGLGAQELPPRGPGALRRGRYPQPLQHPPHRGGPDPDAQAEQLALDPLVAPARVLPRHLLDQHREPWHRPAACRRGGDRSSASGPAAGASAAACPASPAGSSAAAWGAAGPGRRAPPGRPSPASASGSAAAAPPPPGAAPAARHPSTPPTAPAAPSSRSGGRTSGRASVRSQACDAASRSNHCRRQTRRSAPIPRFGTLQAGTAQPAPSDRRPHRRPPTRSSGCSTARSRPWPSGHDRPCCRRKTQVEPGLVGRLVLRGLMHVIFLECSRRRASARSTERGCTRTPNSAAMGSASPAAFRAGSAASCCSAQAGIRPPNV